MGDTGRVTVVGAGVFGAATASELAGRGWDVVLVERYHPGHVRASSGGLSRVLRFGHGDDVWHTRSARRSLAAWGELEQEVGEELVVRTGMMWFAHREDGWEALTERTLRDEGIPVEHLTPADAAGAFPSLATDDLAFVLHEPEAGAIRADRATRALVRQAEQRGARVVVGHAQRDGDGVTVDGERLAGDAVVWACGPWLPGLFPGLVDLRITRQEAVYFGASADWRAGRVPTWVDYDGAAYGTGDIDGHGFKCAPDVEGEELDPDTEDRRPSESHVEHAREHIAHRFPALADAPVVQTRVCQYSLTADTRFILAPVPDAAGVFVAGGGSGHGFKHGPTVGRVMADLVEGRAEPDPAFGLGPREVGTKLRTAGAR
ncbi:MAG: FAD-dependent oxidoreductase [Actinobacteria bacterium]|nr:FAD-dependent oxidoreductase [Actinomycetota bacterium]